MRSKNTNGTRRAAAAPRARIQTDRWLAWSRQLAGRHQSIPVRRPAPTFMLAVRAGFILRRIERFYYMTSRLWSQLNLSINAHFSTWLSRTMQQSIDFASPQKRIESFHFRSNVIHAAAQMAGNRASRLTVFGVTERAAYVAPSHGTETYLRHDLSTSAIDRIFTRLDETIFTRRDETIFTRLEQTNRRSLSERFENRLSQSRLQIINRITTERQRNEDFRRSLISREHKTFKTATSIRSAESVTAAESVRTTQAPPAWQQQTPDGSPLNLERLTDQIVRTIDSRIIAHRERTGQLF